MEKEKITRRKFFNTTGAVAAGMAISGKVCAGTQGITKKHNILESVDVLVVGGGPAGIGAALGSARKGANTMLIEDQSFFGGVAAWSMGMMMNEMRPGSQPRSFVHEHFIEKIASFGKQAVRFGTHEVWCNVEYLKAGTLDALEEWGCKYLVHSRAVDAVVENNRVAGVVIGTKQGLKEIRAKVIVDCSGDADVAYYAGAETMMTPDDLMPQTLAILLSNIDEDKLPPSEIRERIQNRIHDVRDKYKLNTAGFVDVRRMANSNSWYINHAGTADLGPIDVTDPYKYTEVSAFSNRQAIQMIQSLRESDDPGLREIELVGTGPRVGVRETRRVKGLYVLTKEDALAGRVFEDTIGWRSGYMDLGGQKNRRGGKMLIHDVPYRAILPEKLDGLLTAGRAISASHMASAAGKSMGNCMATGHAAGIAAAISAEKNIMPREINVSNLQDSLRDQGVDLEVKNRAQ